MKSFVEIFTNTYNTPDFLCFTIVNFGTRVLIITSSHLADDALSETRVPLQNNK